MVVSFFQAWFYTCFYPHVLNPDSRSIGFNIANFCESFTGGKHTKAEAHKVTVVKRLKVSKDLEIYCIE